MALSSAHLNAGVILEEKKQQQKLEERVAPPPKDPLFCFTDSFPLVHILLIVLAPRPNSESKAPFAENPETSVLFCFLFKIGENTAFPCLV